MFFQGNEKYNCATYLRLSRSDGEDVYKRQEKLAAERPAPEETLSFYVAECLEFTFAGEFHDHLTMEEALEAYDKIPSERMNADKCIGFCIEEDGGFVGMYELVVNDKVQRENINSINYFRDDQLVQPVSYTHLDVYKRQLLYRVHGSIPPAAGNQIQQKGVRLDVGTVDKPVIIRTMDQHIG